MKTVVLDVANREQAGDAFLRAWETGEAEEVARISFETPDSRENRLSRREESIQIEFVLNAA